MPTVTYPDCTVCCGEGGIIVPACCAAVGVPSILYAHITDTGGCTCLAGVTVTITFTGSLWFGQAAVNCLGGTANTVFVRMRCNVAIGKFQIQVTCSDIPGPTFINTDTASPCGPPFSAAFTVLNIATCCGGTVSVLVNTTP